VLIDVGLVLEDVVDGFSSVAIIVALPVPLSDDWCIVLFPVVVDVAIRELLLRVSSCDL
jgi:hypothetical protein